jgi:hypothetical protein
MTQTVSSSATAYLGAAEFLKRCDLRTVGDLCSDNNVRVASGALASDPSLAAALLDASGIFESYCTKGQRYLPADLALLVASPSVGQGLVYRLLSGLVEVLLWERRPDLGKLPDRLGWVMGFLESLGNGDAILPFKETQAAGLLADDVEQITDVDNRFLVTREANRLYGDRNNRSGGFTGPGKGL